MQNEISADSLKDAYNYIKGSWEYRAAFAFVAAALMIRLARMFLEWLRIRNIKSLAESLGLSYEERPQFGFSLRGLGISLFALGDYSSEAHALKDTSALPGAWYLDYRYAERRGGGGRGYTFSFNFGLALLKNAELSLPKFELSPETIFDRAADLVTKRDIDLPGHPTFSRRYALTGPNRERIISLFSPSLATVFEQLQGDWRVQAAEGCIIAFKKGYVSAGDYPAFIDEARTIFRAFIDDSGHRPKSADAGAGSPVREDCVEEVPFYSRLGMGEISARRQKVSEMILLGVFAAFLAAIIYALSCGL